MGTLHFLCRINRKLKHLKENIKKPPEANAGNCTGGLKELLGSQRQLLINDLKKNLWSKVAVYRNGKLMLDENGEPIAVKISPKHESINRILDSAQKELESKSVKFSGTIGLHPIQKELEKLTDEQLIAIAESTSTPKQTGKSRAKKTSKNNSRK